MFAGIVTTLRPRPDAAQDWVVAREGLVCFRPGATLFLPWEQVQALEQDRLLFWGAPEITLHGGEPLEDVPREAWTLTGATPATLAAVARCLDDATLRGAFPTFRHPEGPPAAVLAGLEPLAPEIDRGVPEVRMGFREDLATLCAKLDAGRHADELKKLQKCRRVEDLERLASDNGGWLTRGSRDPRLKLVRHGTGTFLVVQYDDGWSTTLSQAPFRKRR